MSRDLALVHLAAGIGNIILATPLLQAISELGLRIHLLLDADYPGVGELFLNWSVVEEVVPGPAEDHIAKRSYSHLIPAVPPFYWKRFAGLYCGDSRAVPRPADSLFYCNEQSFYLEFARRLGYKDGNGPVPRLPIPPLTDEEKPEISAQTVVLAPGCKTGEMAYKRWPYYPELAAMLPDVAVVGTPDDVYFDGAPLNFPVHVKNYAGQLSLRRTAELVASAGLVIGNDSGLSHLAAAVGTPVLMLFGPTPHLALGQLAPHARVLRSGLPCEPCWSGRRFEACANRIDCLRQISPAQVFQRIARDRNAAR